MVASIRGAVSGKNSGGTTTTLTPPPGIVTGDLWVTIMLTANVLGYPTDNATKGWWRPDGGAVNSRQYSLLARVYNASDPVGNYTLTQNAAGGTHWSSVAIMDHAVDSVDDIVVGAKWLRGNNGGSIAALVAPSVTTTEANSMVLAFTGEATNTVAGYTVTTANGFTLQTEAPEGGTPATDIEWTTLWSKVQAVAGPSGNFEILYATPGTNGVGQQLAIPSSPTVIPTTGRIGAHISTSPSQTSLTIGLDRLAGSDVSVVLMSGAAEIDRKSASVDSTSGWGNVTFAGLTPASAYSVKFEVDGAEQTDASLSLRTLPPQAPHSFTMVTGSCQFTGSNHPVWDRIREDNPVVLAHMGDLTYADTSDPAVWRPAVEASLTAPRMKALLEAVPLTWTWDNHDRIIADDGGPGSALNFGRTDPATNTFWRQLAGPTGWASSDTAGRTFVIGRVRFIQTDNWTAKTDPDAGLPGTQTFLGAAQKQWLKDTLEAATETAIVWLCQWTTATTGSGRWNSYNAETAELQAWINARPQVKARMIMIGGDSHSVQVTDGSRTNGNFVGIPSYNISGFNRSSDSGHGGSGWLFDGPLRTSAQPEPDWGGYSRVSVQDDGSTLELKWEGVRVGPTGVADVMNTQVRTFSGGGNGLHVGPELATGVYVGSQLATGVYVGSQKVWP